MTDYFK